MLFVCIHPLIFYTGFSLYGFRFFLHAYVSFEGFYLYLPSALACFDLLMHSDEGGWCTTHTISF